MRWGPFYNYKILGGGNIAKYSIFIGDFDWG
jgi:hypothetical protein